MFYFTKQYRTPGLIKKIQHLQIKAIKYPLIWRCSNLCLHVGKSKDTFLKGSLYISHIPRFKGIFVYQTHQKTQWEANSMILVLECISTQLEMWKKGENFN